MIKNLHKSADRDRHQEGDDEGWNGPPQSGLCSEKASVSGLCDRLRQSLYGIGTRRRVRCLGARHELCPRVGLLPLIQPLTGRMCRIASRIENHKNRCRVICREFGGVKNVKKLLTFFLPTSRTSRKASPDRHRQLQFGASARLTMSLTSADSVEADAIRRSAASALLRRTLSSARHERKAVARRAATWAFLLSSASTESATNS